MICYISSTFVGVFTSKSPCHLNGEDTEQMYSKHLSVKFFFRQTVQYVIYTAIFPYTGIYWSRLFYTSSSRSLRSGSLSYLTRITAVLLSWKSWWTACVCWRREARHRNYTSCLMYTTPTVCFSFCIFD